MSGVDGRIRLPLGLPDRDPAIFHELFDELGFEVDVEVSAGRGIDPTTATLVTTAAVPLSIFFARFLDLAATDSYGAVKRWVKRFLEATSPARIELHDSRLLEGSEALMFPADPSEEDYAQLLPQLARAMVWRARELEERGDDESLREAELWYERASDTHTGPSVEAACRLVVMLERRGDPASRQRARRWYERAVDLNALGQGDDVPARWVAALRSGKVT